MSYTSIRYHIVIRTKDSRRTISESYERNLYAYILTFMNAHQCKLYRIGGMPDHIHLLVGLHPSISLSSFMRDLKTTTSKFMKARKDMFPMFEGWGNEYYASTLSVSQHDMVRQYIVNQKKHHNHETTREEILRLCHENNIEIDERYI